MGREAQERAAFPVLTQRHGDVVVPEFRVEGIHVLVRVVDGDDARAVLVVRVGALVPVFEVQLVAHGPHVVQDEPAQMK